MSVAQKACTKCGQVKPLSDYQKRKDSKDGHAHWCKVCQREYDQRPERKAKQNEQWRQRYADNPEYREKFKARIRGIYASDEEYREATKARAAKWDRDNKERRNTNTRRRYATHYGIIDRQRKYKRRADLEERGSFTRTEWMAVCRRFKWRCAWCQEKKKLTVDHIVPLSKGGGNTIDNIQPLCSTCNTRKKDRTMDFRKGEVQQLKLF